MRHATACLECRLNKRRCIMSEIPGICTQCNRKGDSCSLTTNIASRRSCRRPVTSPWTSTVDRVDEVDLFDLYGEQFVRDLIETYLYLIHDRPHSLFHVPTLWQDFITRSLSQPLLLCLCAMGSRLSSASVTVDIAPQLTQWARKSVNARIDKVCLQTVQSCILLANLCAADLQPSLEALYFGVANRMAHIMRMNRTDPSDSAVLRETKCRVWWTLVMADNWCSAGLGIPRQLHTQGKDATLPCDEADFQSWSLDTLQGQTPFSKPGLWAHMIHLVDVFGPINDLNHQIAQEALAENEIDQEVHHLSQRLIGWQSMLPSSLKLSAVNLEGHRSKSLGGPFVALHLGYFHYSTLLYFRYLHTGHIEDKRRVEYGRQCKQMAWAYSDLLSQSRSIEGCEAVYATVGHMTVVSSSVLLHTLLFGQESDLAETRKHLTSNFAALIELKKYWSCLEQTMTRLLEFQESCLRNATNTHRVDEWMVRFLTEHSLPLDKRDENSRTARSRNQKTHGDAMSPATNSLPSRETIANQALASLWNSPEAI